MESIDVCGSTGGGVSRIGLVADGDRRRSNGNWLSVRCIGHKLDGHRLWRNFQRERIDCDRSVFEGDRR